MISSLETIVVAGLAAFTASSSSITTLPPSPTTSGCSTATVTCKASAPILQIIIQPEPRTLTTLGLAIINIDAQILLFRRRRPQNSTVSAPSISELDGGLEFTIQSWKALLAVG